jgi:hypothetical protein
MPTLPIDVIPPEDQTNQRVTQLPVSTKLTISYVKRVVQDLFDRQKLVTKAIQDDLKSGGFVQFVDPDSIPQLVLLSDSDKVLLDKLLVPGTIDNTVPQLLEDIIDLQDRVTALEVFHP